MKNHCVQDVLSIPISCYRHFGNEVSLKIGPNIHIDSSILGIKITEFIASFYSRQCLNFWQSWRHTPIQSVITLWINNLLRQSHFHVATCTQNYSLITKILSVISLTIIHNASNAFEIYFCTSIYNLLFPTRYSENQMVLTSKNWTSSLGNLLQTPTPMHWEIFLSMPTPH